MNKVNRTAPALAFFFLLLFGVPQVHAAKCVQADLGGTWDMFVTGTDVASGATPVVGRCKIVINSNGGVVGSKSSCASRSASGRDSSNITGGKLKLNSSCNISGRIRECEGGECAYVSVDWGRLSRDKISLRITGYYEVIPTGVLVIDGMKR